ncbi:MAG: PstS family phosphate ABC transporter substrate-binding protein [Acidobacteria bacterium]|nr:MAG: PstS family phosphate ABC transporter substrate-binding protein [Acidobacteriota bacterium]
MQSEEGVKPKLSSPRFILTGACAGLLALAASACGGDDSTGSEGSGPTSAGPSGSLHIDGSSTVGPLTQAVAEQFNAANPDVEISVGESGTGGGFEKFCAGETVINDASRPIESEEKALCKKGGIDYAQVQVANDALTVVLNNANPVSCLTVDQLAEIWRPDDPVGSWSEIAGLDPPFDAEVERFGPGTDSGTFDYFTDAINGEEGVQTKDYNNVGEDDNQTVTGVEGSEGGIGYLSYSYFKENEGNLKAAEIDGGDGCVAPSEAAVQDGTYAPLGRPLFIYVNRDELNGDEALGPFVQYYVDNVNEISPQVGFIPMTGEQQSMAKSAVAGS